MSEISMKLVKTKNKAERIEIIRSIPKEKWLIIGMEATGLNENGNDEILRLSLINGYEEILFNELIKPCERKRWPNAEKIHHISPMDVKDKNNIIVYKKMIENIFESAEFVIGYNVSFDLEFLYDYGISVPFYLKFDVMKELAPIIGRWSSNFGNYSFPKFEISKLHYKYKLKTPNSLENCKAILFCFNAMLEDDSKYGYLEYCQSGMNEYEWYSKKIEDKKQEIISNAGNNFICPNDFTDILEFYSLETGESWHNFRASEGEKWNKNHQFCTDEIDEDIYYSCLVNMELTYNELFEKIYENQNAYELTLNRNKQLIQNVTNALNKKGVHVYKSVCPSGKFVVICSCMYWLPSEVEIYHGLGYKVTTLQKLEASSKLVGKNLTCKY